MEGSVTARTFECRVSDGCPCVLTPSLCAVYLFCVVDVRAAFMDRTQVCLAHRDGIPSSYCLFGALANYDSLYAMGLDQGHDPTTVNAAVLCRYPSPR